MSDDDAKVSSVTFKVPLIVVRRDGEDYDDKYQLHATTWKEMARLLVSSVEQWLDGVGSDIGFDEEIPDEVKEIYGKHKEGKLVVTEDVLETMFAHDTSSAGYRQWEWWEDKLEYDVLQIIKEGE